MRKTVFAAFIIALISLASCRTDFDFQPSTGSLAFSKDTVYLDTVFTDIGSSTYTLKVYNKSNDNISIPTIQLGKGLASKYRITVDGMTGNNGKIFNNVELLAKDSLFIFVETTANIADANPDDFLYTDQIQFGNATDFQKVELVTLIQDAVFLYPQKFEDGTTETLTLGSGENAQQIYGFFLDDNDPVHGNEYQLTNDKPYVIYGYAGVASGKTLNIEAGARLHFHADSGIIVANGATLNVNGNVSSTEALENEVIFEGDRLEPGFSDVPGQWGLVWLTSGSMGHINHLTLKNSVVGFLVENNAGEMSVSNTQIYNNSVAGILARNGNISGENLVINNCGQACFAGTYGGKYNMTHCTFNNDWPTSAQSAVLLNNFIEGADPESNPLTEANFNNCIIYGSNQGELNLLKYDQTQTFNYKFDHCLIRFNNVDNEFTNNPLYNFSDPTLYDGCLIAKTSQQFDPKFFNADNNKLNISPESAAFQTGSTSFSVPVDVNGTVRTSNPPDMGAYQSAAFPEEN
ncbi:hypothetical protein HYN48_10270 [Flavobacterium magnum]|uniref:Right handed beta helix domain-containing protein n=2 Tax=Flavobacterium magnum TaxID=2162713 RepID=A0A2S0RJZ7_9FLAO|nr:hypothetical protein [Flavobacterium magnum]AWA31471.1 hypothetical protein HYN48_10270 [Flavobacterium magnum]